MFSLSSLTDTSLRRIYKFVLKKVIGDYLEDELLIEQLEVKSREGRVILRDLSLCAASINEYLHDAPITVVSATVRELHALISYSTILTDGCIFTGHGVRIVLAPNTRIHHPKPKAVPPVMPEEATIAPPPELEEDHILTYLAQWIEVVIARLQLKFEDVTIEIRDSADAATATSGVLLHFPQAVFFNTHPQQMRESTVDSVSAAASLHATHLLGNKKLVELVGVSIDVVNADDSHTHLLTSFDTLSAQIMTRPNTKSLEIDVFASELRCSLQRAMIIALNRLACSFSEKASTPKPSSDKSNLTKSIAGMANDILRLKDNLYHFGQLQAERDLDRMAATEGEAGDGVDLSRVAVLLKKYQAVREKLEDQAAEPKASIWKNESGGYSSGEFPDSDGDESIGSDDFVDASQGLGKSRQSKFKREPSSSMNQSLYGAASVRFMNDVSASHAKPKSGMTIRLHVEEFFLFFEQHQTASALELRLGDIIVNFDMMRINESVVEPHFSLSVGSLRVSETELVDVAGEHDRISVNSDSFIRFSHIAPYGNTATSEDIIPSPHVDLTVAFTDGCMMVDVLMPHLVASLNVSTIQRWSSIINDIFPPTPTETSTLAVNCKITVSSVEVIMWCDNDSQPSAFCTWEHMASSLGLCAEPEWTNRRWISYIHSCERYGVGCFSGSGGFRIVANELHGSLQSKAYRLLHPGAALSSSQHTFAEAKEIKAFMRIPVPRIGNDAPRHSELLFMTICMTDDAVDEGRGVIVYKDKYAVPHPHVTDESNDKFVVPEMNIKDIVVVHAQRVDIDMRQLELSALQAIASALTPPLTGSTAAVKPSQPSVSGWGIRIISAVNTFHLSQDVCLSHENNLSSNGPMYFGLSIHDSNLEIHADSTLQQKRLYFGLSAVDMSLFEMTQAQAAAGVGSGRQCQGARFSDDGSGSHFSIPFLHRTSLQNHLHNNDGWEDLHFVQNMPYVAAVKVLVIEDVAAESMIDAPIMKNVAVFIDLHDVTYRYDPDSNWMTRLPELLSAPPSTIAKSSYHPMSPKDISPVYGITRVHIRLQKVLIDYCQPASITSGAESRLLLRIGDMALKSTIVTNSPQLTLKVSVKDIAVRVANRLLRAAQFEQLPLDFRGQYSTGTRRNSALLDWDNFIDAHAFVLMGSIDYFDVVITLQSASANSSMSQACSVDYVIPLSVDVNVATGVFYGCADSLLVLAETISTLISRIKSKVAHEDNAEDNEEGIQIFSAQHGSGDVGNMMVQRHSLHESDTGVEDGRSRTLRGKTITPKSSSSCPPERAEMPPLSSPQKTVLDAIDQSMFRPHTQTVPASARLSSASRPVESSTMTNESDVDATGGLAGAMIEDFYQKQVLDSDLESRDYQARWIPQYDYSDTEEDLSMSGFGIESKKEVQDIPADLLSSDEESDDSPMPSSMWASWGGARIVKVQHEDQEMTEMTEGGGKRSPSTVDEDLDVEFEEQTPEVHHPAANSTTSPITSFPFLDADAQRAWRTGDVDWHDLEQKAGWFSDLGVTSPKVLPYYVVEAAQPSPTDTLDRNTKHGIFMSHTQLGGDGVYPKARFMLRLSLKLRIFDGLEWRPGVATTVDNDIMRKVRENEAEVIRRVFGDAAIENKTRTDKKQLFSRKSNTYALPPKATSTTRSKGDMSEMSLHEIAIQFVMYPKSTASLSKPIQRLTVSIHDALLSYARAGKRRKKILGAWKGYKGPKSVETPLFHMTMDGYDLNSNSTVALPESLEFRLIVRLMPIRCYLDGRYIEFVRSFVKSVSDISARNSTNDPDTPKKDVESTAEIHFFQFWHICPIEIKLDYQPLPVNLKALHSGDYLQLLNLFPIEGMEVKLTDVKATGISGMGNGINLTLQEWVNEIYANQIHRIVSGAAIFRGLSSIGSGLQGMLLIPAQEYKKHGVAGALKGLQKGTMSLLRTVTNEALHATHQVTRFLATSLVDLVSPESSSSSRMMSRNEAEGTRQPLGFVDSLDRAYDSVARELHSTLDTVVAVPVKQYKRSGPGGFVKSVVRAIPVAIIRPAAGTAEAISYTVLGLRNNLDPTRRRDEEDMWNVDHTLRPSQR